MATIAVTKDNFASTVDADKIVLIDFWASWCGPCRQFGPIFEDASNRHTDVTFAKVDTDAEQELAGALQISSIPTLMGFREGVLVFRQAGVIPGSAIDDVIKQIKDLDMDEVKAKLAKETNN